MRRFEKYGFIARASIAATFLMVALYVAAPAVAAAVEVQYPTDIAYELTDVEGNVIGPGYIGDVSVLAQGIDVTYFAWERVDDAGLGYPGFRVGVYIYCVEDGRRISGEVWSPGNQGGFEIGDEITAHFRGSESYLPGKTYRIEITFHADTKWPSDCVYAYEEFTIGTGCSHESAEIRDAYDATCTDNGYTGDLVCSDCGAVLEEGAAVEALGHDANWVTVVEATEEDEGLEWLVCSRDGDVLEERAIPRLEPSSQGGQSGGDNGGSSSDSADSSSRNDSSTSSKSGTTGRSSTDAGKEHDRKATAGLGEKEKPDTEDGSDIAGAAGASSTGGSSNSPNDPVPQGGSPASTAAAIAQDEKAQESGAAERAETMVSSQTMGGNVYRILAGGQGSEGTSDADGDADGPDGAATMDITVVGFPILWVLMWASLPTAFALGLARRYGRNAIGVRRPSRLALLDRYARNTT